jgi:molybdopterin-containing oxidoreductase family iron-sulfur binding subunit
MSKQPDFWTGVQDKNKDEKILQDALQKEFQEVPVANALKDEDLATQHRSSRRDFLKYLGFSVGAATLAASCEIPVKRAIPYVVKPDDIVPGVASYYASTILDKGLALPVLVKTREGRPIKIEGNAMSDVSGGGTSARVQASVLSLYDTNRYKSPFVKEGRKERAVNWDDFDKELKAKLSEAGSIKIISNTQNGPSAKKAVELFAARYGDVEHIMYDGVSQAAQLEANNQVFGVKAVPNYHFDKAKVIASFDADFLGTWISPVEYAADYSKNRKIKDVKKAEMSRHIQLESRMSYTGSNADERILIRPSEMAAALANLHNELATSLGASSINTAAVNDKAMPAIKALAKELLQHRGESLVVSGSNDLGVQLMAIKVNQMLGNYGNTLDMASYSMQKQGDERDVQKLLSSLKAGSVGAIIFWDCNPIFELPNGQAMKEALANVKTTVALGYSPNETYEDCQYIAPTHHNLEAWGDAEAKAGHYSLVQPTIAPLFDTRQAELSLLTWAESLPESEDDAMYAFVKSNWQNNIIDASEKAWTEALHNGIFQKKDEVTGPTLNEAAFANIEVLTPSSSELEVNIYETITIGAGEHADNPWLQEMPDPIMRTVWGNYLSIPVYFDGKDKFSNYNNLESDGKGSSDVVETSINETTVPLIIVPQFGQMDNTFAVGLGYGRTRAGRCGGIGQNVNQALTFDKNGFIQYWTDHMSVGAKVGVENEFACVQYHHTYGVTAKDEEGNEFNADEAALGYQNALMDRSVMRYGTLDNLETLVDEIKEQRSNAEHLNENTIYPSYEDKYKEGHHWSMYVDMNACTGCGACTIACMAENNVPVVGKREVHRHHEMTWIRIDRYYFGDVENPNVVYQPMMCQHCDNAPCENVCPVAATNHSSEGLNQMTYNRCIGTRYCANNCPYKVRRFNWLDYTTADLFAGNENYIDEGASVPFYADNLTRMVLNPDVTVRSRGVIEKCSFCVQRIQEGKLTAKSEMRPLADGDIKTACQTACPTGAIIFGDDNDKDSMVTKHSDSPLVYKVLEEVNTASSVNYSAKVVNKRSADV